MSKRKEKVKAVRIETLQDLVDVVTPQNYELLMKDTALWLYSTMMIKAVGAELKGAHMLWTDDGKNELTGYDIKVRNKP